MTKHAVDHHLGAQLRDRPRRDPPSLGSPPLHWEDIKWDRGHIEIAGRKAKTAARRLVPLPDNLKAWLAPWRNETGPTLTIADLSGSLSDTAVKAKNLRRMASECPQALVHQLSGSGDRRAGNSPRMVFRHYREVVDEASARAWWPITPP